MNHKKLPPSLAATKNTHFLFVCMFLRLCGIFIAVRASLQLRQAGATHVVALGLLVTVAPLVADHRLWSAWAPVVRASGLWSTGLVVVVHGLSCSVAGGVFPDQRSNPCLLLWQVDSLPLSHQGSPIHSFTVSVMLEFQESQWGDFIEESPMGLCASCQPRLQSSKGSTGRGRSASKLTLMCVVRRPRFISEHWVVALAPCLVGLTTRHGRDLRESMHPRQKCMVLITTSQTLCSITSPICYCDMGGDYTWPMK